MLAARNVKRPIVIVDRNDDGTYYMWARLSDDRTTKVTPLPTAQEAEREAWLWLEENDPENRAIVLFRRSRGAAKHIASNLPALVRGPL